MNYTLQCALIGHSFTFPSNCGIPIEGIQSRRRALQDGARTPNVNPALSDCVLHTWGRWTWVSPCTRAFRGHGKASPLIGEIEWAHRAEWPFPV